LRPRKERVDDALQDRAATKPIDRRPTCSDATVPRAGDGPSTGSTAVSTIDASAVDPSQLVLMDGFALRSDGAIRRLPVSAQRLVAFVALQGRAVSRQRAAFTLWPDASEARAYGSLRTALFRLRAVCPGRSVLECRDDFELSASVGVDVRRVYELTASLDSLGARNGDAKELELLLEGVGCGVDAFRVLELPGDPLVVTLDPALEPP